MRPPARAALLALTLALLPACASLEAGDPASPDPSGATSASATPEETAAPPTTIRVASLKGPTTMGLVGLMADEAGEGRQDYDVTMYGTPDEVVPLLTQGQVDVALLPANLASVLYNRTLTDDGAQVQVAAINTLGMLQVLEQGDTVDSIEDLAGRTVYATGKGTTPEHVLNHLLVSHGLDPATDLTVEYKSEATEVAALLASRPDAIGVLPQPYVTVLQTQNPAIRTALDLTEEWAAVTPGSELVTGVVVVRTGFVAEHPEAFEDFLLDYEASTAYTTDEPAAAAVLIADAGLTPSAAVAEAAIPACHLTYVAGERLQTLLGGYLQVLFDADPASVGGSLPGDDFYYRP